MLQFNIISTVPNFLWHKFLNSSDWKQRICNIPWKASLYLTYAVLCAAVATVLPLLASLLSVLCCIVMCLFTFFSLPYPSLPSLLFQSATLASFDVHTNIPSSVPIVHASPQWPKVVEKLAFPRFTTLQWALCGCLKEQLKKIMLYS